MCSSSLRRARNTSSRASVAVVVRQLLERVGLRGFEEGPELVFGDEMLGVRDVGLFEHAILVHADKEIRNVLLEGQLGGFFSLGHCQSFATPSRARASRTASWSSRSSSFFGSKSVQ